MVEARRRAGGRSRAGQPRAMYANGRGVPQDRVAAHMWLSLAAAQVSAANRDTYVEARDAVAEEMTAEQIAEAQRLAREWKPIDSP